LTTQQTQWTFARANLIRTCYGNWCNGFWALLDIIGVTRSRTRNLHKFLVPETFKTQPINQTAQLCSNQKLA